MWCRSPPCPVIVQLAFALLINLYKYSLSMFEFVVRAHEHNQSPICSILETSRSLWCGRLRLVRVKQVENDFIVVGTIQVITHKK